MKPIPILAMAAIAVCAVAFMTFAASRGFDDDVAAPVFGVKIPPDTATGSLFPSPMKKATSTTCAPFWVMI